MVKYILEEVVVEVIIIVKHQMEQIIKVVKEEEVKVYIKMILN